MSTVDQRYFETHGAAATFQQLPEPLAGYDDALFAWFVRTEFLAKVSRGNTTFRNYAVVRHRRNRTALYPSGPVLAFYAVPATDWSIASAEILIQRVEPQGWRIERVNPNYNGSILNDLRRDFLKEKFVS